MSKSRRNHLFGCSSDHEYHADRHGEDSSKKGAGGGARNQDGTEYPDGQSRTARKQPGGRDSVAAINEYLRRWIVFDISTATTVCVIDENRKLYRGMILPGAYRIADSLTTHATQLQGISLEPPKHMIGKNTIDCMKSGVIYSSAAMVDGLITRIEDELGKKRDRNRHRRTGKVYYSSPQKIGYHG